MYEKAERCPAPPIPDELSLGDLLVQSLRFLQRFGRLLLVPSLILAVCAGWQIAKNPLYNVTGLLEVPDVSLEEWRQAQLFLWDKRWVENAFSAKGTDEDTTRQRLMKSALNQTFWTSAVKYQASLNRDDTREVPPTEYQKSRGLGLMLTLRVRDEEQARQMFELLAGHVRQALLANGLIGLTRNGQQSLTQSAQLKLELLQTDFEIQQYRQRIEDMRNLLERYPELRTLTPNSVISVTDGGGKYLAPLAQVVALETTVSELQARSRKLHHDLERLDWTALLITDMDSTIRNAVSGEQIIGKLKENRDKVLATHTPLPAQAQESVQEMSVRINQAEVRQQAIGLKTRSAISATPILIRNPLLVGALVFMASFFGLSLWLALHVFLHRGQTILTWLPGPLRRWLIVERQP